MEDSSFKKSCICHLSSFFHCSGFHSFYFLLLFPIFTTLPFIDSFLLSFSFVCYFSFLQPFEYDFFQKQNNKRNLKKTHSYTSKFFSLFCFLTVVCLPKQYYKSNSTPVNRLQDWFSSTLSHRGCHIINTDLYYSLVANIHKCQYAGSLQLVKIHEAI